MIAHCVDCGGMFTREADATWKRLCLPCWRRTKAVADPLRTAPTVQELDRQRVRQLLQLCHPDRHGGSPLAQTITQWLLQLKTRIEA